MGYDVQTLIKLVEWGVSVDMNGYEAADIKKVLAFASSSGAMITIQSGYPEEDLIAMAMVGGKNLTIRPRDKK